MAERLARIVLLIGWDAADWKIIQPLLDSGQMPALESVINSGVMGNIASLEPMLSPMLWTSIASGHHADRHGILGFIEPDAQGRTLRPVTSTSRKVKAIWNILNQQEIDSSVVGWFASHPAEPIRGVCVSNQFVLARGGVDDPWPVPSGAVHPAELTETLAAFRLHPGELTAGHLLPFVPEAARIDQEKEPSLTILAKLLAECAGTHAVATWIMEHRPWEFMAVYYDAIDHFCHAFMPFHPPQMPCVSDHDFELYKDVVAGAYRFNDMMLARLLELAGPETTVVIVSDHGFHSDHLRPTTQRGRKSEWPIAWHRPYGIVCMKGPNIRHDERIYGANLLDITPTILTLFGLPIGEDMAGRPLVQAFDRPIGIERIPTWEDVPGASGMHGPDRTEDPWEAHEAIQRLVDLGYIDAPGENIEAALREIDEDRLWNLARVQMSTGRYAEAAEPLRELLAKSPEDSAFTIALAQCMIAQGKAEEGRRLLESILALPGIQPRADLLMGSLLLSEGETERALEHLARAEQTEPRLPTLHCLIGDAYLRLKRWPDAERAFGRAIEIDGDSAQAHHGLAVAALKQRRFEDAADAALIAVGLLHHFPLAHFVLGVALARIGETERAIQAFKTSLAMRPRSPAAHRWLAVLHDRLTGNKAEADRHRVFAYQLR